jgi:hypothetical protein
VYISDPATKKFFAKIAVGKCPNWHASGSDGKYAAGLAPEPLTHEEEMAEAAKCYVWAERPLMQLFSDLQD